MKKKREEGTGATCNPIPSCNINAKVGKSANKTKDLERVFQYFRYTLGTSLDCANSTRILRNSITWYIAYLESQGMLQAVKIAKDSTTGFMAKHYSADPKLWVKERCVQLELFKD